MRPFSGVTIPALARVRGRLQLERAVPLPAGFLVAAKLAVMLVFAATAPIVLPLLAGVAGSVMFDMVRWVSRLVLALIGVVSPASLLCWR